MDLGHLLSCFICLLELNFCESNVDIEAILLLTNSPVMAWTSSKSSLDG